MTIPTLTPEMEKNVENLTQAIFELTQRFIADGLVTTAHATFSCTYALCMSVELSELTYSAPPDKDFRQMIINLLTSMLTDEPSFMEEVK